jgi:hypothetical protein
VNFVRQLLVYAVIFLLGLALFGLIAQMGIAVGLATETARWLGFGGLAVCVLALVIIRIVRTRQRNAPPGGIQ